MRAVTYQAEHSDLTGQRSVSEFWGEGYRAGALKTYLDRMGAKLLTSCKGFQGEACDHI